MKRDTHRHYTTRDFASRYAYTSHRKTVQSRRLSHKPGRLAHVGVSGSQGLEHTKDVFQMVEHIIHVRYT